MILGSSQVDDDQFKKEMNTKQFFSIIDRPWLPKAQVARLLNLIDEGINIDGQDGNGTTVLYACVRSNNYALVQKLIALGAKVNTEYANFHLHRAVKNRNSDMVRLLITAGAEVNNRNIDGKTPLHLAVIDNQMDVVELLLSHGAEVGTKDHDGNTPLHLAMPRFPRIAELLLSQGADAREKNNADETPVTGVVKTLFNELGMNHESMLLRIKNTFLIFIHKFIEAGWVRFDILRHALGRNYALVETADEMVAKIIDERKEQLEDGNVILTIEQRAKRVEEIFATILILYPNAAKMAKRSLTLHLLDAIEYPPVQACAASSACIDDEQPPAMMITSVRKRNERDGDSESESEENTKRSRTRCSIFCR